MGIVFRQSIKSTIVIFAGALLGAGLNIIYTHVFSQTLLGVSRNLINQGAVLYLFLMMGTISIIHTYAQRYALNDPKRPVVITFSLIVPVLATGLFCIPYFLMKDFVVGRYQGFDRQYLSEFYNLLPVLGLLWSFMALLEYYLMSQMKVALGNSMREIVLRLGNVALLGAFFFDWIDFHQFVVGTVLVHLLPVFLLFYFSSKTEGFGFSLNWKLFSKPELKSIVHYSWYHMLLMVSLSLTGTLDILLLAPLSPNGLADVATYNFALFLISILIIPYKAMSGAAFPRLNQAFVDKESNLHSLFNRSSLNMQIVAMGMWLIVVCNLQNAVAILPGQYADLAPCVLILSIGRMIDMATGLNTELISITNYYKFTFRLSLALLVAIVVLDRIFIPHFGLFGAAWVSTITLAVFNLFKMGFLYRKMRLSPISKQTGVIALVGIGIFLLNFLLPQMPHPVVDALYRSVILVSLFAAAMYYLRPSPDLHDFLQQIRKNKRLF